MKTFIFRRTECAQARGLCVVIDVIRAFTTAAFAFEAGAKEIVMVSSPEEAFQKFSRDPSLILMGEVKSKPIKGFHLGNSPFEVTRTPLEGRRMVQRTSSGTQGVVGCQHAHQMLVASFVVAEATLQRILALNPTEVSFIVTGRNNGDEDLALAEYLQARLQGQNVAPDPFLERVRSSPAACRMLDPTASQYAFGKEDLELALRLDHFSFAMEVSKWDGELVAKLV